MGKDILSSAASRSFLGPTQAPIQWVQGTVKPVLNGPFIKRNFVLNGNIFRSCDYHSIPWLNGNLASAEKRSGPLRFRLRQFLLYSFAGYTYNSQRMKLSAHLHLMLRLKIPGVIPPLTHTFYCVGLIKHRHRDSFTFQLKRSRMIKWIRNNRLLPWFSPVSA
jgi:hypothetical protein